MHWPPPARSGRRPGGHPRGGPDATGRSAHGIEAQIKDGLASGPALAMVDSDNGITNLHVPSDVIIDASMPAMIRNSGHMWGPDGNEADTLAVIPDSSYATIYQVVIDDCRANGSYDPTTMGDVPNVGLMAQAAEEYGSHDKTFEIAAAARSAWSTRTERPFSSTRLARETSGACARRKTSPVRDWVKLAVPAPRSRGDPGRVLARRDATHDANLIAKVRATSPNTTPPA